MSELLTNTIQRGLILISSETLIYYFFGQYQ